MKRILKSVKIGLVISLIITLLSGCGGSGSNAVSSSYPLESVTKNGGQESRVYRAANKTVPQVAPDVFPYGWAFVVSAKDIEYLARQIQTSIRLHHLLMRYLRHHGPTSPSQTEGWKQRPETVASLFFS